MDLSGFLPAFQNQCIRHGIGSQPNFIRWTVAFRPYGPVVEVRKSTNVNAGFCAYMRPVQSNNQFTILFNPDLKWCIRTEFDPVGNGVFSHEQAARSRIVD